VIGKNFDHLEQMWEIPGDPATAAVKKKYSAKVEPTEKTA
jgi:hypothetical protein